MRERERECFLLLLFLSLDFVITCKFNKTKVLSHSCIHYQLSILQFLSRLFNYHFVIFDHDLLIIIIIVIIIDNFSSKKAINY